MDEKMKKTLLYVLAGFAGFIILLFLISSCSKRTYDYEDLVQQMLKVTKNYYKENKDQLPSQDKDTQSYTLKKMISDGKIEELSELFNDDSIKCDGNVTVINNNGYYLYTPYLSCGEKYNTTYLKDKVIENSLVESDVGLYEVNNNYVFKGEVKNNFVNIAGKIYRIIRINEDGSMRIIEIKGQQNIPWDNRYNDDYNLTTGINEYEYNSLDSRIKETLKDYYDKKAGFTDETKQYFTTFDLCIGKRSISDTTADGSTECAKKIANQPLGLLTVYEYLQASLDKGCTSSLDANCKNYNWMSTAKLSSWMATADIETSKKAFKVIRGDAKISDCNSGSSVLAVLNLTEKAIYVDGDGTEENPYTFQ